MQDRFKYRFFDVEDEKMYDVKNICFVGEPTVTVAYKPVIKKAIYRGYLIQCTGKKDKHDILMYEGDRVYIASEEEYATIEWSDDLARFVIHFEDEKVIADFDNYYDKELEVVGNIYEGKQC